MTYHVRIGVTAREEMEQAYQWIAERSPENATGWFQRLEQAIDSLTQLPDRCPIAPENDAFEETVHQLLFGKRRGVYRILYTIREDAVEILHVRHAARQFLDEEKEEGA